MQRTILATSINYSLSEIIFFLKSLEGNFSGDLVIFSNKRYDYKSSSYKIVNVFIDDKIMKLNTSNNERFYWYQRYLNENPEIKEILLTDIRDVIFQDDPFKAIVNDKLQVALEDEVISRCKFNSNWIKAIYGNEFYDEIKRNRIFCSGTIVGERESVIDFINFIVNDLEYYGPRLDVNSNHLIMDQAIFNKYCISFPEKINEQSNSKGKIYTMGYAKSCCLGNHSFQFLNSDLELYPIVHQYDRYQWITESLKKKYNIDESQRLNNKFEKLGNKIKARLKF